MLIWVNTEPGVMGWYGYKKELCVSPAYAENVIVGIELGSRVQDPE